MHIFDGFWVGASTTPFGPVPGLNQRSLVGNKRIKNNFSIMGFFFNLEEKQKDLDSQHPPSNILVHNGSHKLLLGPEA